MTRTLLFSALLAASASAQAPVDPNPSDSLSSERFRENAQALQALAERFRLAEDAGPCAQTAPMPTVGMGGVVAPAPSSLSLDSGLRPAPIPNLCGQSLAVLPPGVRFRTDPLPLSEDGDLGRQLFREQRSELFRSAPPYDPRFDFRRLRPQIDLPELERIQHEPLVAPPGNRP